MFISLWPFLNIVKCLHAVPLLASFKQKRILFGTRAAAKNTKSRGMLFAMGKGLVTAIKVELT